MQELSLYSSSNFLNWDAVGAISTALATIVALIASSFAVYAPVRERAKDRSESTYEVLCAAKEALELFEQASTIIRSDQSSIAEIGARAGHLRVAIDRLLNRNSLSDGAIVTGAGAIQLMDAIRVQCEESNRPTSSGLARRAPNLLAPYASVSSLVRERGKRVARYAVKRKWPRWRQRYVVMARDGL